MTDEFDSTATGVTVPAAFPQKLAMQYVVDLPADYCAALGEIASRWTWLENQLGVLIRVGFELDKKEGRVLLGGMALKVKASVLRITALKWVKDAKLRADLTAFAKDCQNQIDNRNDHVHGLWCHPVGQPQDIGLFVAASGEQRYDPEFKSVPFANLKKIAADFKALQVRGQELTDRIKGRV